MKHAEQSKEDTFGGTFFFIYTKNTAILLQRDETRRMCSSNTRATVLDWFVGDGELAQVVAAHLRLKREQKTNELFRYNNIASIIKAANLTSDKII